MARRAMQLLTPRGVEKMKTFTYKGVDLSLLYKYFSGPLAQTCVTFLPRWLAPNLVTLIGLAFPTVAYLLTNYYSPDFRGEVPSWVLAYSAVAIFLYSLFDNMDGKQARRTGSSSPLGLLFDHGCDSFNATMSPLLFATAVQAGDKVYGPYVVFGIWWAVIFVFFFATWEEYHTGHFVLPIINGPNEGLLGTELALLATAAYSSSVWAGWEWLPPALTCGSAVITTGTQLINVHRHAVAAGVSPWPAYRRLVPCLLVTTAPLVWIALSPAFAADHIRWIIVLYGVAFYEVVARFMVAHVTDSEYSPPWPSLALCCGACAHAAAGAPLGEGAVLSVAIAGCAASSARYAYLVITEFCEVLGISWYRVPKRAED